VDGDVTPPPFAIGSDVWPGLGKLVEELGELQQVAGTLLAFPDGEHPDDDGTRLEFRLADEMGDVLAAVEFVAEHSPGVSRSHVRWRAEQKLRRFEHWHAGGTEVL
jgi:NTP pyrophosphatase (non-canonical NTP hydrolase)